VLRACDSKAASRELRAHRRRGGVKQHPETAKGHVFLSLEDETGLEIIIGPHDRRYKRVLDSDARSSSVNASDSGRRDLGHAQRLDALQLFAKIAAREWQ